MTRPRARESGLSFGIMPTGKRNSISDIPGVKVGHCSIISGSGALIPGKGPVRTGVTAVLPHGDDLFERPVKGAYFDLNGCGGLLGSLQIDEFGIIETPIMLTNTMSIGAVADALVRHMMRSNRSAGVSGDTIIPIVSECDDSFLNDSRGLHVKEEHVSYALNKASEEVGEGSVGGGTGMTCCDFKGGIGTSSRTFETSSGTYTVGSLVMANHGIREDLMIKGVPVGRLLETQNPRRVEQGSIVMVVGTDAPLDARQLLRMAKRGGMGLALTGSCSNNGSGDIVLAFSTANQHDRFKVDGLVREELMLDGDLSPIFRATVDATEESIVNSLFKAGTMDGRDGNVSPGLPIEETLELLKTHKQLT